MSKKCYGSRAERQKAYRKRKNFSGSAFSAKADGDKRRMAATAEEGTAPKPVQVNAGASMGRPNSGNEIPCDNLTAAPVLAEPLVGVDPPQQARESTQDNAEKTPFSELGYDVRASDSRGGSQKPSNVPQKEWDYACERAQRATDYAAMFPNQIHENDKAFQDPMWQWLHMPKPFNERQRKANS